MMKQAILLKILQPFATLASGIGKRKKLFILIYHRVLDEPDYMRPGEVDKAAFTWQMELLAKHFNVLPLEEALQRMQNDSLPPRAVSITFDDGYADNYTNALPILQQFNLTATFFIASGFLNGGRMWNDTVIEAVRNFAGPVLDLSEIGLGLFEVNNESQRSQAASQIILQIKHLSFKQRDQNTQFIAAQSQDFPSNLMMTDDEVRLLHQRGMTIGGHTVNHPILSKLDSTSVAQEINDNKAYLESLLDSSIQLFAYPNGKPDQDYLPEHVALVKQAGYQAAVATQWGVVNEHSDKWQLPRFTPWDRSHTRFMLRMISRLYSGDR